MMTNVNSNVDLPKKDEASSCQSTDDVKPVEKLNDCPVCLQKLLHPVELPCGHIFCFLCVKGFSSRNRRCALCRKDLPLKYFEDPKLVKGFEESSDDISEDDDDSDPSAATRDFCWYYEGRNGWWQYDKHSAVSLEESYKSEEKQCEIMIAGFVYVVNFQEMTQHRKTQLSRKRRIKRDKCDVEKKGIAGLNV